MGSRGGAQNLAMRDVERQGNREFLAHCGEDTVGMESGSER